MLYATLCFTEIYQTSRQHIDILLTSQPIHRVFLKVDYKIYKISLLNFSYIKKLTCVSKLTI